MLNNSVVLANVDPPRALEIANIAVGLVDSVGVQDLTHQTLLGKGVLTPPPLPAPPKKIISAVISAFHWGLCLLFSPALGTEVAAVLTDFGRHAICACDGRNLLVAESRADAAEIEACLG